MENIINVLQRRSNCILGEGASIEHIRQAEIDVGVEFSDDYIQYLLTVGLAMYDGHELTGISKTPRLSVVDATKKERQNLDGISANWYVIEEANIDGIVIWQSSDGTIYQTQPGRSPIKLCNSLCEYISM